jgi:hypothetical protein
MVVSCIVNVGWEIRPANYPGAEADCIAPRLGDSIVYMNARGRQSASNWLAYGVGLLLLATIVAWGIGAARKPKHTALRVTVGTRDEVYYSLPATLGDATALGHALQATGFFDDSGTSVQLSKNKGVTVVSFVVNQGGWEHAETVAGFEEIARRVATSVGGFPIQVHLVDPAWNVHKSLAVGKATIGARDVVYYLGSATEGDAQALGQALRDAGYLDDLGVSVVVSKGDASAIGFVVGEGVWERGEAVAGFERLIRRVAASVGGLPIQLRLLNAEMETKKDVAVE